jgi:hypothetical protein
MIELLATIIVIGLCIAGAALIFGAIIAILGTALEVIWWLIKAPWNLYRWWQQRRIARDKMLAQRAAEIQRQFIREAQLQNGPQGW